MSASGGSILAKMKDGFRMHPQARVFDARGQVEFAPGPGGVLDERPSAQALAGAFGGPFRIGGAGALQAGVGAFETLTSGSSGQPRRIVRTCASWAASFAVNAGLFGIGPGVRVAVLGRLVHSLALDRSILLLHVWDLHDEAQFIEQLLITAAQCLQVPAQGPR